MSTMPIMFTALFVTPVMCMISNSWLVIWVALEINTLSFCSIITENSEKFSSGEKESSMKYFVIQSVASAILIMYMSFQKESPIMEMFFLAGTSAVLIKLAATPFHGWFVEIMKMMKWKKSVILMTWQKLAPIYLLTFMMKPAVLVIAMLSAMVGSASQINAKTMMEVMALSSIFNLSWMMLATMLSAKSMTSFIILYWVSVFIVVKMLTESKVKEKTKDLSSKMNQWSLISMMAMLAGLPPSAGFAAKWTVVTQSLKSELMLMSTTMLIMSAVNFYVYLRMTLSMLMSSFSIKQKTSKPKSMEMSYLVMASNIPVLYLIIMYSLRLKKDYFDSVDIMDLATMMTHNVMVLNHQKAPCCTPLYKLMDKNRR